MSGYVIQCYIHNGPKEGTPCMNEYCVALREAPAPSMPVFLSVPGGATANVDWKRQEEKGLIEYGEARKQGLQPDSTRAGSVEKMERDIESQQRGLDRLSEDMDTSHLRVRPGVER